MSEEGPPGPDVLASPELQQMLALPPVATAQGNGNLLSWMDLKYDLVKFIINTVASDVRS